MSPPVFRATLGGFAHDSDEYRVLFDAHVKTVGGGTVPLSFETHGDQVVHSQAMVTGLELRGGLYYFDVESTGTPMCGASIIQSPGEA